MKYLPGFTDIFMSPQTGEIRNHAGDLPALPLGKIFEGNKQNQAVVSSTLEEVRDARFILEEGSSLLPNAQSLAPLSAGIVKKNKDNKLTTEAKLSLNELPELKGEIVSSLFSGDIWRGTSSGVPEPSKALTMLEVDIVALNTRLLASNFIMGSAMVKSVWQGAQFLDDLKPGILMNGPATPRKKAGYLKIARPNIDYLIPEMARDHKGYIWMATRPYDQGVEVTEVKAPWLDAKLILQDKNDNYPKSQALSELNIANSALIEVNKTGVIEKATLQDKHIWIGNTSNEPVATEFKAPDSEATYILQKPNDSLPNAQALDSVAVGGTSLIKVMTSGVIEKAIKDVDYITPTKLEEFKEEVLEEAKEAGATAGAEAGTEAGTTAGTTAGAIAGADAGATAGATAGAVSGGTAGATAGAAAGSKAGTESATEYCKKQEIRLQGDVNGVAKLNEVIITKIKDNPVLSGKACVTIPGGMLHQRPKVATAGMLRFIKGQDSTINLEFYNGKTWQQIAINK